MKLRKRSLDSLGDHKILEMPELWDTYWGKLQTVCEGAQEKLVRCSQQQWMDSEIWGVPWHQTWKCPAVSWTCFAPACTHYVPFPPFPNGNIYNVLLYLGIMWSIFLYLFYKVLQLGDYRSLRRNFEPWTFRQGLYCDRSHRLLKFRNAF